MFDSKILHSTHAAFSLLAYAHLDCEMAHSMSYNVIYDSEMLLVAGKPHRASLLAQGGHYTVVKLLSAPAQRRNILSGSISAHFTAFIRDDELSAY